MDDQLSARELALEARVAALETIVRLLTAQSAAGQTLATDIDETRRSWFNHARYSDLDGVPEAQREEANADSRTRAFQLLPESSRRA